MLNEMLKGVRLGVVVQVDVKWGYIIMVLLDYDSNLTRICVCGYVYVGGMWWELEEI